jgi:FkbM family methyltransferase
MRETLTSSIDSGCQSSTAKKVIYDIGANNGDDIPYYLQKADVVVAIEANPVLCKQVRERFAEFVESGRVIIENCVMTARQEAISVPFYISKDHHVGSRFPKPAKPEHFAEIIVPAKRIDRLIAEHGFPYYVKIDTEYYDHVLLRALFDAGIRPPLLSAESHNIKIFLLMASVGRYKAYKIVDGCSVEHVYKQCEISTRKGPVCYSFPSHSAGPFGDDIAGEWISTELLFRRLVAEGLGWKDIHAISINTRDSIKCSWSATAISVYLLYSLRWQTHKVLRLIRRALGKVKRSVVSGR